jgi:hypothetical protein
MDEIGLLVEWAGKLEFVTAYTPSLRRIAHVWFVPVADKDVAPGIGLCRLGAVVAYLLTGERIPPGPYVGAGFQAKHESEEAARRLRELVST